MRSNRYPVWLGAAALAVSSTLFWAGCSTPSAGVAAKPDKRIVVTKQDDLPRHVYKLPALPSLAIQDDAVLAALRVEVERDLKADLTTHRIEDRTTLQRYRGTELAIAMLEKDYKRALELVKELRSLEEKPALQLTTALVAETLAKVRLAGVKPADEPAAFQKAFQAAAAAMPWEVVGTELKEIKAAYEIRSAALIIGNAQQTIDPAHKNSGGEISGDVARTLVGMRNQLVNVLPLKERIVAALEPVIAANKVEKPDRWTPRLVELAPNTPGAKEVVVAVWDSGVDTTDFAKSLRLDANGEPGIAFDLHSNRVKEFLFPLGEANARVDSIVGNLKGWGDLQANIDSAEASALKKQMSALKTEQVKPLIEDLNIGGNWAHGSHVAGISIAGNPYARLVIGRITFDHRMVPELPTIEQAKKDAIAGQQTVDYFRSAGVRVVNMSWGGGLRSIEEALEVHGAGGTPEERKKLAREIFMIGRNALYDALKNAPEILWVAAAGNSDNNVAFDEFIPSSFQLPNMITVGAVDKAGEETSFSSFGPMVNVHANGFEVLSNIPGGRHLPFSGTSMAAPQVTNLAAKLFALSPSLTPEQAKALILAGAEKSGRVNLVNPKKSIELLRAQGGKVLELKAK